MSNWNDPPGGPDQPDPANDPTDTNDQPQPYRAWGTQTEEPAESRYLGLTASQFNLAFFAVIGAIAVAAFLFLGGAGAVGGLLGDDGPARSTVSVPGVSPTATTPAPAEPSPTPVEDDGSAGGGGDSDGPTVFDTFDPLSLVSTLSAGAPPAGATNVTGSLDESLGAALLREGDLPAGFTLFGEMTYTIPIEGSSGTMAANIFASGDVESGDFGTMVMSAALAGESLTDLASFDTSDFDVDLAEVNAASSQFGITVTDVRLLDASGLGDAGAGMHMVMDFGGLLDGFGDLGEDVGPTAFAWDMYLWVHGDRGYMLMVMWNPDGAAGVDSRALADIVNGRAGG